MPNNDYIKRADALQHFENYTPGGSIVKEDVINGLKEIPAADVAPVKHVHWVYKMRERNKCENVTGFDELGFVHTVTVNTHVRGAVPYCSLCDALAADSFLDYCPRCGAKMQGEEDGAQ